MNICTTVAINNAIAAASCANAAAAMANRSNDCHHDIECDEHDSFWFGLLAIAIVLVIIPAIIIGLLMLCV